MSLKFQLDDNVMTKYGKNEDLLIVTGVVMREFGFQYLCKAGNGYEYIYYGSELVPYVSGKRERGKFRFKVKDLLKMTNAEMSKYLANRTDKEKRKIWDKLIEKEMYEFIVHLEKIIKAKTDEKN